MDFHEYMFLLGKYRRSAEEMLTILPNFSINEEILFDDYIHVKIYVTENKVSGMMTVVNLETAGKKSLHMLRRNKSLTVKWSFL
jgi:hypothetical protein